MIRVSPVKRPATPLRARLSYKRTGTAYSFFLVGQPKEPTNLHMVKNAITDLSRCLPCLMSDHVAKLCSAGSNYFVPVPVPVLSGLLPPPRRVSRRS
jgi:hypothetical protein